MPYDMTEDIEGMYVDDDPAVETATFTVPDPDDLPDGTLEVDVLCEFIKNVGESSIYDRSFFDKEFYNVVVETSKDWLQLPTHYVPVGVKRNTPVTFRNIQYYVYRAPHDGGHGVSAIFISKDRA
jgi:hypothetical protein